MNDALYRIRSALEGGFIAQSYPVLAQPGVRDEDMLVHSLGCSLWTTLGHDLGFSAVVEAPAPSASGADIRSDSAWFTRGDWRPVVLVEFERFEGGERGQSKLLAKLQNLMEAAWRWGTDPRLLVLSAWSKGVVNAPRTEVFRELLRSGFRNAAGVRVPGYQDLPLLVHRLILNSGGTRLLSLDRSLLEEIW
ncbi:hypothetical protein [uncultured Thiodictyon sp.]|uniref:hypothetical protein n=1 Tax=uncultured Thiodictyon sp. TaxID=1846217 RepID=UPI0025D82CEC|nr:hypothetical protein [uncultured Thiodictyon sp.]